MCVWEHHLLVEILTHAHRLTFHSNSVDSRRREGGHISYPPLLNMYASKIKQRGVIRLLVAEGVGGREMHRRMKTVLCEYSLRRSSVVECCKNALRVTSYWKMMFEMDRLIVSSYRK
ncbi:uncharacterized protein TNCV_231641 [Trichonephila clavipes]|nr:uncharacterized protein TNCV_231641 [Trichonephila clavipes]